MTRARAARQRSARDPRGRARTARRVPRGRSRPVPNYLRLERLDRAAGRLAILGPIARGTRLAPGRPDDGRARAGRGGARRGRGGPDRPGAGGLGGVTPSALVERIEAPYLQLVLERLWETERAAGSSVLRRETLRRLGGAALIVEEHVERSLAGLIRPRSRRRRVVRVPRHAFRDEDRPPGRRPRDLQRAPAGSDGCAGRRTRPRADPQAGGRGPRRDLPRRPRVAVADWRREQEAAEALEQERRRHRRLLAILVGALVALALVGALAIYAVSSAERGTASRRRSRRRTSRRRRSRRRSRRPTSRRHGSRPRSPGTSATGRSAPRMRRRPVRWRRRSRRGSPRTRLRRRRRASSRRRRARRRRRSRRGSLRTRLRRRRRARRRRGAEAQKQR